MEEIYAFAFTDLRISKLWLNYGRLRSIDHRAFLLGPDTGENSSLQAYTLRTLDLTGNQLTRLADGVFNPLRSLRWLALGRNRLTSLSGDVLMHLGRLRGLYLYSNRLRKLPAGLLSGTRVRTLYAYDNNMTSLSGDWLRTANHLQLLHLANNPLTEVSESDVSAAPRLSNLVVDVTRCDCTLAWMRGDGDTPLSLVYRGHVSSCGGRSLTCYLVTRECNVTDVTQLTTPLDNVSMCPGQKKGKVILNKGHWYDK